METNLLKIGTYTFKLELQGKGNSLEEAWQNAVEAFTLDPGLPDEVKQEIIYSRP